MRQTLELMGNFSNRVNIARTADEAKKAAVKKEAKAEKIVEVEEVAE